MPITCSLGRHAHLGARSATNSLTLPPCIDPGCRDLRPGPSPARGPVDTHRSLLRDVRFAALSGKKLLNPVESAGKSSEVTLRKDIRNEPFPGGIDDELDPWPGTYGEKTSVSGTYGEKTSV
jgi:hypothetical protein